MLYIPLIGLSGLISSFALTRATHFWGSLPLSLLFRLLNFCPTWKFTWMVMVLVGLLLSQILSSFRKWIEHCSVRCSKLGLKYNYALHFNNFIPDLFGLFFGLHEAIESLTSEAFRKQLDLQYTQVKITHRWALMIFM